jgi:OOP family OmpA-OmpF porin
MKKLLTFTFFILGVFALAQTDENKTEDNKTDSSTEVENFKRWSLDLGVGSSKPTRPFVDGFTANPGYWQADLGLRYNLTRNFGLGLELGYNSIQSGKRSENSTPEFNNQLFRVGLEGVINVGNIVNLKQVSPNLGLLFHGGPSLGYFKVNDPVDVSELDFMLNFTAGITPQYRISDNFAVFGDISIIGTTRNDYSWDGVELEGDTRGFEGAIYNVSAGVTFYFGNGGDPADWAAEPANTKLDDLEEQMAQLLNDIGDEDQDGVPNYLDRDNTTESGVRVDSKGRALDNNKNGIPDDMETGLDNRYASQDDIQTAINGSDALNRDLVRQLINEGYINVYFKFNSTQPTTYSLWAINTIVQYMKDHPNESATLTGYADEIGTADYNMTLSERRAKMVNDVIIAAGVDGSRLSFSGGGVDASVDKNNSDARQLVRRVTFRVK